MTNREGSGVAVKKWMQGRLGSLGSIDTILPVVQNPPESMQMPLGLSLRIDIITSAVTEPKKNRKKHVYYCRIKLHKFRTENTVSSQHSFPNTMTMSGKWCPGLAQNCHLEKLSYFWPVVSCLIKSIFSRLNVVGLHLHVVTSINIHNVLHIIVGRLPV